ncbi:insecticidal toxin complex protein TccC [Pseudomonas frederiksbergensis]
MTTFQRAGGPFASVHSGTPTLSVNDSRGLIVRRVEYLRKVAGAAVETLIDRHLHDVPGRAVEQWDPRLFDHAPTANVITVYQLTGAAVRIDSVDAGWRLSLFGVGGEVLQHWDQRANHWRTTYDDQLRVIALEENAQPNVERFTYAHGLAEAGHNLRGQMIEQVDPSGRVNIDSFNLGGQALRETRTFAQGQAYLSHRNYSALGAVLNQTDAGQHQQQLRYDIAGQLKQVLLQLKTDLAPQPILLDAQYNAAGQRLAQTAANNVISNWTYDPADGRLCTLKVGKPGQALLQDLMYQYDPTGNVLRIDDHTLATVYFANQRVESNRQFKYDSLYRLIRASGFEAETPNRRPGLPPVQSPIDTARRYNYVQHYDYDAGSNLTTLRHERDNNNHTHVFRINPHSNRGVRWEEGDPDPVFEEHFDAQGNLLSLQKGQPLHWNSRGQLAVARLIERSDATDDEETYVYSQGVRVSKQAVSQARAVTHTRTVLYLPGLEIRTRDNTEALHVITLPGNVRCLHWVTGQPADIEPDQLRYSLDDHLGSSSLELDRHGERISQEIYYPFGGTAWWAARSAVEASYKTIRYSGKEMDVSGLYYYGARYYAPWLQRWVSADPAGDVDGLNLYAFVGNNPIIFVDEDGEERRSFMKLMIEPDDERAARRAKAAAVRRQQIANRNLSDAIERHLKILELTSRRAKEARRQIANHRSASSHGASAAIRTVAHIGGQALSYGLGVGVGGAAAALGSVAGPVGVAFGIILGFLTKKAISSGIDFAAESLSLSASVKFKAGKLNPERIVSKGDYKTMDFAPYVIRKFKGIARGVVQLNKAGWLKASKEGGTAAANTVAKVANPELASEIGAMVSTLAGAFEILHEVVGAGKSLTPEKVGRGNSFISGMIDVLNKSVEEIGSLFETAGRDSINTYRPFSKVFGTPEGDTLDNIKSRTDATITQLRKTQATLLA